MQRVRIFIGLNGDLNPNAQMFLLKLLNKVRLDNPHTKVVVVSDSQLIRQFVCKQTGYIVSDFVEGEFERAYIITDKEDDPVDETIDGEDKYQFPVTVVRLRDGCVRAPPTMNVRPDEQLVPFQPVPKFNWGDHYTDFDVVQRDDRQWIPLTLTPDLPMPTSWVTNTENY